MESIVSPDITLSEITSLSLQQTKCEALEIPDNVIAAVKHVQMPLITASFEWPREPS